MRKFFLLSTVFLALTGCTSIEIPSYVSAEHPYKKTFYASYDDVVTVVSDTLKDFGWEVTSHSDPSIYEQSHSAVENKETLIFTEVRQTPMILWTRYSRLNAYVKMIQENVTEVEFRYVTVTSIPFKSFYSYRKDGLINHIFRQMDKVLNLN